MADLIKRILLVLLDLIQFVVGTAKGLIQLIFGIINSIFRSIIADAPVIFRVSLYFLAVYLPAMIEKVSDALEAGKWPSPQHWLLGHLLGFAAGIIAVRAFYDGSAQRHADEKKGSGNTTQFYNPLPITPSPKP
jgi:hypothetical protein